MKPGDVLDAPAVPSRAIVRDGSGAYYVRHGRGGQVVRCTGPYREWGELRRFFWFDRGRFELVALDVDERASSAILRGIIERFEADHGAVDFGEDGCAVPTTASEV